MKDVMTNFLKKRAFLTPERTAVFFQDQKITFNELYERSLDAAGKLQDLGIWKQQFAGVLLKNHLDSVIILFALQLLGVRAIILNNRLTPAELIWQLKDSKASFLILEDSFADFEPIINEQYPSLISTTKSKLFSREGALPAIQNEVSLNEICTIMYTSGTTGNPKGVIQTYGNHWSSAIGSALNLGISDSDCWLCSVPIFHISGYSILMKCVLYGMPIVLHEKFDAELTIQDIQNKKVTLMSVVGTTLTRIVEALHERRLPSRFRCMLLGGGPAPLPLLEACMEKSIPVFQTYGMTETSSQIVTLSPDYSLTKLGSAGKPLFPSEIKIELEDGSTAHNGQPGEIVVKGPNVTEGYLFRPEATEEKIRNGWLYTGDIGYIDAEGFLYVLDRRSDLIISGGENVYPAEIEAVLLSHQEIQEAGVTGLEDPAWGQVPAAFVVPVTGSRITAADLEQFCLQQLAKYKVPKVFYFADELPRNAAKKLLRRTLKEWVEEGRFQ
ncbi:o-succinylbenzoate--CoA ligase [Bacillus sp. BRMEA1]|uniref:o-succinylbenzoate--CoA ligase n=1 Tax=Neobacillus endophyticus TaxID=2738405 RepID=UPI001565C3B2|nr:o-succinylbenzoate--CoA ligase [Neobacillus endophyticus]NRD76242.1 o-succinylbenzoate--CoA ligase [Neobacillus endophyticus]